MKRLAMAVVASSLLLASCGTAEWKVEQELGDEALEKRNYQLALQHYEASYEMKELESTKEKMEKAKEMKEKQNKNQKKEKEATAERRKEWDKPKTTNEEGTPIKEESTTLHEPELSLKERFKNVASQKLKVLDIEHTESEGLIYITLLAREGATEKQVRDNLLDDSIFLLGQARELDGIQALSLNFQYDFHGNPEERDRIAMLRFDDLSSLPTNINKEDLTSLADAALMHPAINDRLN